MVTDRNEAEHMTGPGVSVIVPAYNEEAGVRAQVEHIAAVLSAEGMLHEVVVVDDAQPTKRQTKLSRPAPAFCSTYRIEGMAHRSRLGSPLRDTIRLSSATRTGPTHQRRYRTWFATWQAPIWPWEPVPARMSTSRCCDVLPNGCSPGWQAGSPAERYRSQLRAASFSSRVRRAVFSDSLQSVLLYDNSHSSFAGRRLSGCLSSHRLLPASRHVQDQPAALHGFHRSGPAYGCPFSAA